MIVGMAVKIVSEAPVRTKQVTCSKCCYRLEYTGVDVKSSWRTDYTGECDEYHYIECPKCQIDVSVSRWSSRD